MKDMMAWRAQLLRSARQSAEKTAWAIVVSTIAMSPRAIARRTWPSARRRSAWAIVALAIAAVVFNSFSLWWTGGGQWTWLIFWIALIIAVGTTVAALVPQRLSAHARVAADMLVVHRDVVAGGTTTAPLATHQPERVYPIQTPHAQRGETRIYGLDVLTRSSKGIADLVYSLFGLLIAVFSLVTGPSDLILSALAGDGELFFFAAMVALIGLLAALRALLRRRPIRVVVADTGLVVRSWGYWRTVPWPELRALCRLEVPDVRTRGASDATRHIVFLALGEHTTIAWTSRPSQAMPTATGQPLGGEAWRICGVVAARSGLLLRDLTPAVSEIVLGTSASSPEKSPRAEPAVAATSPSARLPRVPGMLSFLAVVPLLLALAGAGVSMPRYEAQAYASEIAASQARVPLLADPLGSPTGLWPTGETTHGIYTYVGGVYRLESGEEDCCGMFAWAPQRFGDAIVSVTMHTVSDFDLSEAGLIVRADDASHTALVFAVTPSGEWHVTRYRDDTDDFESGEQRLVYEGSLGRIAAIHQGNDATNRLTVIMRGTSYAFFVNNHLVGLVHSDGPAAGHVGMFSDGLSGRVDFRDFVVSLVPPPSPLLPV